MAPGCQKDSSQVKKGWKKRDAAKHNDKATRHPVTYNSYVTNKKQNQKRMSFPDLKAGSPKPWEHGMTSFKSMPSGSSLPCWLGLSRSYTICHTQAAEMNKETVVTAVSRVLFLFFSLFSLTNTTILHI